MRLAWDSSLPTPSIKPSAKPMRRSSSSGRQPPPRTQLPTAMERMMMVPSGGFQAGGVLDNVTDAAGSSGGAVTGGGVGRSSASGRAKQVLPLAAAAGAGDTRTGAADPGTITPRTDLPTLFNFPESVHPAYRPLPIPIRVGLAVLSAMLAAVSTCTKTATRIGGGSSGSSVVIDHINWRRTVGLFAKFALRALLIGTLATTAIQEAFLRPSRIDTATLVERGWLPSPLSRFDSIQSTIAIPSLGNTNTELGPLGVHYLRCGSGDSAPSRRQQRFDVLHCNHGFGASSLSWLPALPSLAERIGAGVGLAHDAVGFGFTSRPKASRGRKEDLIPYSLAGSAAIGTKLVINELEKGQVEDKEHKSVALFGHSMGCTTTLRMALDLPRNTRKVIVLVAPALMLPSVAANEKTVASSADNKDANKQRAISRHRSRARRIVDRLLAAVRRIVVDVPFGYFLRRVVGKANFWMSSLQSVVWGHPDDVSDADGLRFQWPAIGLGWERGLLAFTRSRLLNVDAIPGGDVKLLSDVLNLPDTRVIIVAGGNDKIIPPTASRNVAERFSLRFVTLQGRGHDPFEENPEEFVNMIEALLQEQEIEC
mmetsp:Transcript_14860/g.42848  ORF Transcript_14860/g.42848 Transcript_14860/m.42848 type:complete len:595 (+) Transcript_14860:98-1882(+)